MGPPHRDFKDKISKSNVGPWRLNSWGFSEEKILSSWPKDSCDILAKNANAFCLCPKNLLGAKLKINGLISLVEEISTYSNINFAVWFLIITLMFWINSQPSRVYGSLLGQDKIRTTTLVFKESKEYRVLAIGVAQFWQTAENNIAISALEGLINLLPETWGTVLKIFPGPWLCQRKELEVVIEEKHWCFLEGRNRTDIRFKCGLVREEGGILNDFTVCVCVFKPFEIALLERCNEPVSMISKSLKYTQNTRVDVLLLKNFIVNINRIVCSG